MKSVIFDEFKSCIKCKYWIDGGRCKIYKVQRDAMDICKRFKKEN